MENFSFIKNKNLLEYNPEDSYAIATYKINSIKYDEKIIEEIAIGQSIGVFDTKYVSESILKQKLAKVIAYEKYEDYFTVKIAFPYNLWLGNLSWLLTILFGKMSFYSGVQLNNVEFTSNCKLNGPKNTLENIRKKVNVTSKSPLLMGILKPNVAMTADNICNLYVEAAESGIHLLKDDEIRFDEHETEIIKRVELVTKAKQLRKLNTLYAVHLQINRNNYVDLIKNCENAGADAFLINSWICGLDTLQHIRSLTQLPIMSHPALVGAFGQNNSESTIHPRVSLAQLIRAAGADFSLFPSPYGKLGLPKNVALEIAHECLVQTKNHFLPTIPVPSAGIKPEHSPIAKADFGTEFILNAGTAIFSGQKSIKENIYDFKKNLQ